MLNWNPYNHKMSCIFTLFVNVLVHFDTPEPFQFDHILTFLLSFLNYYLHFLQNLAKDQYLSFDFQCSQMFGIPLTLLFIIPISFYSCFLLFDALCESLHMCGLYYCLAGFLVKSVPVKSEAIYIEFIFTVCGLVFPPRARWACVLIEKVTWAQGICNNEPCQVPENARRW